MILCCANVLHRSSSMTNTSPIVLYTHTYVLTHTHTKCSRFFLLTLNYSQTLIFSNSSRSYRNTCTQLYIYTHTRTYTQGNIYLISFIVWGGYHILCLIELSVTEANSVYLRIHALTWVRVSLFCGGLEVSMRGDISAAYFPEVLERCNSAYSWFQMTPVSGL